MEKHWHAAKAAVIPGVSGALRVAGAEEKGVVGALRVAGAEEKGVVEPCALLGLGGESGCWSPARCWGGGERGGGALRVAGAEEKGVQDKPLSFSFESGYSQNTCNKHK